MNAIANSTRPRKPYAKNSAPHNSECLTVFVDKPEKNRDLTDADTRPERQ
jgi:hypothetical protein